MANSSHLDQDFLNSIGATFTPTAPNAMQQQAPQQQSSGPSTGTNILNKARDIANVTRIPAAGAGLLQGGYNTLKSVADIAPSVLPAMGLAPKNMPKAPDIDLSKYVPQDPITQTVFGAGEIGGQAAGELGAYKTLSKIPGLVGEDLPRVLTRLGISGAATGENAPGGRTGGSLLSMAGAPFIGMSNKTVADNVAGTFAVRQAEHSVKYNNIFNKANEAGIDKIDVPDLNENVINKFRDSKDVMDSVNNFQINPTIENAHQAQSDLGKMYREASTTKKYLETKAKTSYTDNVDALGQMRDSIKQSMYAGMKDAGVPELAQAYKDISKSYAENVAPYLKAPIKEYLNGKETAGRMLQRLKSNGDFMKNAAPNHPDFLRQSMMKKIAKTGAKYGAISAGTGLAGALGLSYLSNNNGGNQ